MTTLDTGLDEHEMATVEFEPVPVFEPGDIPMLLDAIRERRCTQTASYGAYLIHSVERDEFSQVGAKVLDSYPGGYELKKGKFPAKGGDRGLHRDNGVPNDVTAHHTQVGKADFAILVGSSLHSSVRLLPVAEQVRLRDDLLIRNQRRVEEVGTPDVALRASIASGDLLLFDHKQPHVFKTTGMARWSLGRYCEQPLLSHSILG